MCQLCEPEMERLRVLLASKVVGLLPKEDDTELDGTIDRCIQEHAAMVSRIDAAKGQTIIACPEIRPTLAKGIRKALPTISIEDRFRLALAAGAVKL